MDVTESLSMARILEDQAARPSLRPPQRSARAELPSAEVEGPSGVELMAATSRMAREQARRGVELALTLPGVAYPPAGGAPASPGENWEPSPLEIMTARLAVAHLRAERLLSAACRSTVEGARDRAAILLLLENRYRSYIGFGAV